MTPNQKNIALIVFVLAVVGGAGYLYFREVSVPLEGVDKKDVEELKQIRMV
jgi:hypothetical protein